MLTRECLWMALQDSAITELPGRINRLPLVLLVPIFILGCFSCTGVPAKASKVYYINPAMGSDANDGLHMTSPFKSLRALGTIALNAGDSVLLAADQTFTYPLILENVHGTKQKPIVISHYNGTAPARIVTTGHISTVLVANSSYVEVNNLSVTAGKGEAVTKGTAGNMRCGVLVIATEPGEYEHIYLTKLKVQDVFYEAPGFKRPAGEVKTANGTQSYGWGIRVINKSDEAILRDVRVLSCSIDNVGHTGIKFTTWKKGKEYKDNHGRHGIIGFEVAMNTVSGTGGPGIQMSGVKNGHVHHNTVDRSGSNDDTRKWGRGSGLWTWGSKKVLIENNRFTNANGPGDSAGAHIDFNCSDIVMQYNFSANNAGGFCEILGNNYNCAYRYNISVNDGHRVKGEEGAFQEGKTFWLSGYCNGKRRGPYNSYFYNNTIYVNRDIVSKIAIDRVADGVLIANNIFHIEGDSKMVKGDQYNPETDGEWKVSDVFFQNNLFLTTKSWPSEQRLQDGMPLYGTVEFANLGGMDIVDYRPVNKEMVVDKGIEIPKLEKDSLGLAYGLAMEKDILGNPIDGLPDLGAIEMNK
ncbi:MAG: right-handed parallel beta-helix repeat-containing protein [Flavobacteriaceae bacterium]